MKLIWQILIVLVMAAIGYGGWAYRAQIPFLAEPGKDGAGSKRGGFDRAMPVDTKQVRTDRIAVTVDAVGTARANESVIVTAKVSGLVKRIAFEEGESVAAGKVLVELDASELQAELAEARAEATNAKRLYERAKKLYSRKNITQVRMDELESQLAAAQARVKADRARLDNYVVRAPFAGRLGLRSVSLGALVTPGTQVTTLDDSSRIKLDFEIPETALAGVRPGLKVHALSAAYPDRKFEGQVATIDSRVDPVTRTVKVRAMLLNDDRTLKPGMFLNVAMVTGTLLSVLAPEEAVLSTSAGRFVFVVKDGKAERIEVKLGHRLPGEVQVLEGLDPKAEVVVGGLQKVRHGAKVMPRGKAGALKSGKPTS